MPTPIVHEVYGKFARLELNAEFYVIRWEKMPNTLSPDHNKAALIDYIGKQIHNLERVWSKYIHNPLELLGFDHIMNVGYAHKGH